MDRSTDSYSNKIQTHLVESAEVKNQAALACMDQIVKAANLIAETFTRGGKLLLCGNGGSAADAQHMATEFVSALNKGFDRPGLPAIALTTDSSILTAYSNDFGFEGVFARQVQALGKAGDSLIGFSTSGNSKNVINAIKLAKQNKIHTIVLTGNKGKLAKMAEVAISVPSSNTQYIQETHLAIEHAICEVVEYKLFMEKKGKKSGHQ